MRNNKPLTDPGFRSLTSITAAWLLLLIFGGAIVQATNTGLGCPEWFLCSYQTTPPLRVVGWLEFGHYAVASIAALLTVGLAITARRAYGRSQRLSRLTSSALAAAGGQVLMVAGVIWFDYHPLARAAYLVLTIGYLTLVLLLTAVAHRPALLEPGRPTGSSHRSYLRLLLVTGAALLFLLLSGVTVTGTGTASACPDWPLCQGRLLPLTTDPAIMINLFHRLTVILVAILIATIVLRSCRQFARQRLIVKWAVIVGLLYLSQIAVGGWSALMPLPRVVALAVHLSLTTAIWSGLVILTALFYSTAPGLRPVAAADPPPVSPLSLRQKALVYFKLTKPWIMILLLVTTVTAMFIAAKGRPPIGLLFFTTLGGILAAGGASVLNSYIDSDIDGVMARTSRRATVTGLVAPQETLLFGLTLSVLSFFVFVFFVNTLSAALSTLGIVYYVFFYTLYLKRATIHNIIIGGAAGAIPPLVGWTAVTGLLDLGAFYLFAIIFFWTPPHTWALALLVKKDYSRARVPMLPVVVGEKETTYQIFLYTILLITLTLLPVTFNMLSSVYLIAAIALGLPFIYLAWKLWRDYSKRCSKQLYKFSQLYLALLFLAMAIDRSFFV